MKSIAASILLLASVASAQLVRGGAVQNSRVEPAVGAAAAPAAAAAAAAPAPAAAGTARAVSAGGRPGAPPAQTFGPAFFGPGINNPIARSPIPQLVHRAQEVVAANPNVRVFVDVDGTVEFTDQFGREVEVLDHLGRDALEVPGLEEQLELQKQQFQIEQRRALLMQQLAALTSLTGTAGAAGTAAGAGGAAAANRFIIAQ